MKIFQYLLFTLLLVNLAQSEEIKCKTSAGKEIRLVTMDSNELSVVFEDKEVKSTVFIKNVNNFNESDDYVLESNGKHSILRSLDCYYLDK